MARKVTLLDAYVAQRGLFARVAKQFGLDPSYVSRVAYGKRQNMRVSHAIEAELKIMHNRSHKATRSSMKKSAVPTSEKSLRVVS